MNTILGKMDFNIGFKKKDSIIFCGQPKIITIKLKAYYEKDGITKKQEEALKNYVSNRLDVNEAISNLARKIDKEALNRFIPQTLLFGREGECALLCDDKYDPDDGIAICIYPKQEIVSQDSYL